MTNYCPKTSVYTLNVIFVFSCLVHLGYLGFYVLYPEFPTITVYREHLKNVDFPLSFRLCMNEPKNGSERFRKVGYTGYAYYYWGASMYNESIYGWSWRGHQKNGSNFGSAYGKFRLF